MQILKVYPPRRREKYGNRFLMSLKLPAGRGIYHKSSRSPWNKSVEKRVTNLEYEYRQIRTRMNSTGEEGAKKIMGTFEFFHALDEVLGSRHGVNLL